MGMVTQCCLSHRIIGKNLIIKAGPSQAVQGLVSDFGSCFKLCYVSLNNKESKAQLSVQTSSDLLAKIVENFQKTPGEDRKAHHNAFAVIALFSQGQLMEGCSTGGGISIKNLTF